MRIDLHTHSRISDGTDSPAALIHAAAKAGLDVVSLTDHDSTAGWPEAIAALPTGLTFIGGTELSCALTQPHAQSIQVHILGYLIDPMNPTLSAECERLRDSRQNRGRQIVELLQAGGYPISWERVKAQAEASIGRPHIARTLVEAGAASSVAEAFTTLLHEGGPFYVPKADIEVFAGIQLVQSAGGVPVLAHALARRRGPVISDQDIAEMAGVGLAGIEVAHPDHGEADQRHLSELARDLGLFITGSSDYHGHNKDVSLGARTTALNAYETLLSQAVGFSPVIR